MQDRLDIFIPAELAREMRPAPGYRRTIPPRVRPAGWKPQGVVVYPRPNESPASVVRRFARAVAKEGVIADHARHARFVPPSQRRRTKRLRAEARRRRAK